MNVEMQERFKLTKKEQYDYLIKARNFHYDNYAKWANYFYLITVAIFIALYNSKNTLIPIYIPCVGLITSLAWHWSSKGYYYWNINFVILINKMEEDLSPEDRVYSIFHNKRSNNNYLSITSGANISTPKVNIAFTFLTSCFWATLILDNILSYHLVVLNNSKQDVIIKIISILLAIFFLLIVNYFLPKKYFQSDLKNLHDMEY